MSLHARRVWSLTLLVVGLGCPSSSAEVDSSADPASRAVESESSVAASPGPVILLDAGQEPRSSLRLAPRVGADKRWRVSTNVRITLGSDDAEPPFRVKSRLDLETRVTAVERSAFEYRTRVLGVHYPIVPNDRHGVAALRTALNGLELVVRSDLRGRPIAIEVLRDGAPVDASSVPQLGDTLTPSIGFPSEPIGVGARWQEIEEIERGGLRLRQTSEHELVARDDDLVELHTRVTQRPMSRTLSSLALPPATTLVLDLDQFKATGEGSTILALDQPMPHESSLVVALSGAAMLADDAGSTRPMKLAMNVEERIADNDGSSLRRRAPGRSPSGAGGVARGGAGAMSSEVLEHRPTTSRGVSRGGSSGGRGGVAVGIPGGVPGFGLVLVEVQRVPLAEIMVNALHTPEPDRGRVAAARPADAPAQVELIARFCVTIEGRVIDVFVDGSGGTSRLSEVVKDTVNEWRFKPIEKGGRPIRTCTKRTFVLTFE